MADLQLQLSWESYQKNICNGLGLLQQRGEFVDMTIAADGHHVKVHQMILSLISPFIKDLITSANCPHPVIFLNKISYQTLQSILEYAYTGQVLVARENLGEFLDTCKSLHIKGLESDTVKTSEGLFHVNENIKTTADAAFLYRTGARDITESVEPELIEETQETNIKTGVKRKMVEMLSFDENGSPCDDEHIMDDSHADNNSTDCEYEKDCVTVLHSQPKKLFVSKPKTVPTGAMIQYTLSCQGSIQIVVNRYIYHMRHTRKNNERMWRCQDYNRSVCRAYVITKGELILERGNAHNHPFHDKQILKRVQNGNMFTGFSTVETIASLKKQKAGSASAESATKHVDGDDDDDVHSKN